MDEALVLWLRSRKGVVIGAAAAAALRHAIGQDGQTRAVRARDVQTGRPREVQLSGADLVEAVAEPVARVREAVLQTLAETPPELAADIHGTGIVLCGGCARFPLLGHALRQATDLPVARAAEPETAVIRGAALLMEHPPLLQRVAAVG
jgi:rod shape-determining protein MreB